MGNEGVDSVGLRWSDDTLKQQSVFGLAIRGQQFGLRLRSQVLHVMSTPHRSGQVLPTLQRGKTGRERDRVREKEKGKYH